MKKAAGKILSVITGIMMVISPALRMECHAGIIGTAFSVTVPTQASVVMDEYGDTVAVIPNIINRSTVSVSVTNVTVVPGEGWTMMGFEDFNPADAKVDSDIFAISLNGDVSLDDGTFGYTSSSWTRMSKTDSSSDLDELPIECEMKISPVSTARDEKICSVIFTVRKA